MRGRMLEALNAQRGPEATLDASWLTSTLGMLPSPLTVIHVGEDAEPTPLVRKCARVLELLTEALARKALARDNSDLGLSIPSKSTCGFPFFESGDDGLAVRNAIVQSAIKHRDLISKLLDAQDWDALMGPGLPEDAMPLFPITTAGWRLQSQRAQSLDFKDGKLSRINVKERWGYDCAYDHVRIDFSVPGSIYPTMRSRHICQVSATVNILAAVGFLKLRATIMSYPMWHVSSVRQTFDTIQSRVSRLWGRAVWRTYDFSRMDESQRKLMYHSYVKGLRGAGFSKAFCNLALAIHFSPFIIKEDDPNRDEARPLRLVGNPSIPWDSTLDLGCRSGEADTDVFNKLAGTAVYCTCAAQAGLFYGLSEESAPEDIVKVLLDRVLTQRPDPQDHCAVILNCGDDHGNLFDGDDSAKRFAMVLAQLSPYFNVSEEPRSQLLGNDITERGVFPYIGKMWANILSPEREWSSPMRRDGWAIGVNAQLQHYAESPDFQDYYEILVNECQRAFSTDPAAAASQATLSTPAVTPVNAAEQEILWNPETLSWKYGPADVRPEFVEQVPFFLYLSPSVVQAMDIT